MADQLIRLGLFSRLRELFAPSDEVAAKVVKKRDPSLTWSEVVEEVKSFRDFQEEKKRKNSLRFGYDTFVTEKQKSYSATQLRRFIDMVEYVAQNGIDLTSLNLKWSRNIVSLQKIVSNRT